MKFYSPIERFKNQLWFTFNRGLYFNRLKIRIFRLETEFIWDNKYVV